MKKIKWVTLKDTGLSSAANDVTLSGSFKPKLEIKVIKNGKEATEYREIKGNEQQATVVITMKFQWNPTDYLENSDDVITYYLKKSDDWQINDENQKVTWKPGKEAEFQEAKKEAHKKLLKKHFPDKIGKSKEEGEISSSTDLQYVIGDNVEGGKINVIIYGKNTPAPNDIHFPWDQVKIEPEFFLNKKVDFDSVINTSCQEDGNKSRWTKGWIVFFVIFGTIILLGIIFHKKIWHWIKGEREQEKKVREQIDIF